MSFQNCKVTKADVDLVSSQEGLKTVVTIETISVRGQWTGKFVLTYDPLANFQLSSIMDYAGVNSVRQMEGRIIREVVSKPTNEVIGFGDPIKDQFILIGANQKAQTYTESGIKSIEVV